LAERVVTSFQLETRAVTIGVPHGDLLAKVGVSLGRWQEEVDRLSGDMSGLQSDGVFLDGDNAVVPGWWERKEDGHHKAWYLVWPAEYARRSGRKRREYVRRDDLEMTRAMVQRSLEYASLKVRADRLTQQIEAVGFDLTRLAARYGW